MSAEARENPPEGLSEENTAALFNRFLAYSGGACWTTDADLRVTWASGEVSRIFRVREEGPVGRSVIDLSGDKDPTAPLVAHHLSARSGQQVSFRLQVRDSWFELKISPLREPGGDVTGCVATAVNVTDSVRLDEKLQHDEAYLEIFRRTQKAGLWEWDMSSDLVTVSPEMNRLLGGVLPDREEREAIIGLVVHPDDAARVQRYSTELRASGRPIFARMRAKVQDGSFRMFELGAVALPAAGAAPNRAVGVMWDIHDLYEANGVLERTVSVLEATFDATADGILAVGPDHRIDALNERLKKLWKIPPELVSGRDESLLSFMAERAMDGGAFLAPYKLLSHQPEVELQDVVALKDGKHIERDIRPRRVGGKAGTGWVCSFRDVTERERALQRAMFMANASRLLSSLETGKALEAVSSAAVPFLGDSCIVDLFGDENAQRSRIVTGESVELSAPSLSKPLLAGHAVIQSTAGTSCMSVPIKARGSVVGALSFFARGEGRYGPFERDVADELASRASLAIEMGRFYDTAQQVARSHESFLSVATHELRGPLASMHLALEGLRRTGLKDPAKFLEIVERDERRLMRFVEQIDAFAQIQASRLTFDLNQVDLATVAREVANRLEDDLKRSGSRLTIQSEEVVGKWDRTRLEEVVSNLLSNAIKFGLGNPIEMKVHASGARATLVVKDNGSGVPSALRAKIFEPFERVDSGRHYGGLGLGLYIARTLVNGLGGSIRLEPTVGGSVFVVELPQGES
ncbi:MAG: ATP-binding protein [Myxococcaceae bacterium]